MRVLRRRRLRDFSGRRLHELAACGQLRQDGHPLVALATRVVLSRLLLVFCSFASLVHRATAGEAAPHQRVAALRLMGGLLTRPQLRAAFEAAGDQLERAAVKLPGAIPTNSILTTICGYGKPKRKCKRKAVWVCRFPPTKYTC